MLIKIADLFRTENRRGRRYDYFVLAKPLPPGRYMLFRADPEPPRKQCGSVGVIMRQVEEHQVPQLRVMLPTGPEFPHGVLSGTGADNRPAAEPLPGHDLFSG